MPIRMQAIKSFSNKHKEGDVRVGQEFDAADEARASDLERVGLAVRSTGKAGRAASATSAAPRSSSSRADRPRSARTSTRSAKPKRGTAGK